MNQRPPGSGLLLSSAIEGFLQYKTAEAVSPRTIECYKRDLNHWLAYAGDVPINQLTTEKIRAYLAWLRTEYKPRRIMGDNTLPLSPKTLRNIYVTLSSFFTWAQDEFQMQHPMRSIPAPKFQKKPVDVFSKDDIEALLKACDYMHEAQTTTTRKYTMRRSTAKRDRAILLILLDTGLRASELCSLKIGDVDTAMGKVEVKHGVPGGAKGGKGRTVFLGKVTRRAVWRYLADREDRKDLNAPLILGKFGRPMNRDGLRQLIDGLGERANIKKCYPHRFRHTFAITYLRSGGDVFTLQALLGHGSLDMVQHYARIAEVDVEMAHRRASPADNWRL